MTAPPDAGRSSDRLATAIDHLPRRAVAVFDEPSVSVHAVLHHLVCHVESSGPDTSTGPGPAAVPPVWFGGGTVTAVAGAVDLDLHEWSAEPAVLAVRVVLGAVTVAVPDDWAVRLDVRSVGGLVVDERVVDGESGGNAGSEAADDGPVNLVVDGFVAFGRVEVVGRPPE